MLKKDNNGKPLMLLFILLFICEGLCMPYGVLLRQNRSFYPILFRPHQQKKIASSLAVVEKGGGGHIYQEQNDFFLYFVGLVSKRKGFDIFLDVVCHCVKYAPTNIRIRAVAFGVVSKRWAQRNRKPSCMISVDIRGAWDSELMWQHMITTRGLFLMTSRHENEPMELLESAIYSYPAISLATGGARQIISNSDVIVVDYVDTMKQKAIHAINNTNLYVPNLSNHVLSARGKWISFVDYLMLNPKSRLISQAVDDPSWILFDISINHTDSLALCSDIVEDWIVLYDSTAFMQVGDLTAKIYKAMSIIDIGRTDKIVPIVINKSGRRLATYEPYGLLQNHWDECKPSQPFAIRKQHYCNYLKNTLSKEEVEFSSRLTHFGVWFEAQDLRVRRVTDIWFVLTENVLFSKNCVRGDMNLFHTDHAPSSFFFRKHNSGEAIGHMCAPLMEEIWGNATKKPTICRKPPSSSNLSYDLFSPDNVQLSASANCGAWCLPSMVHPKIGWMLAASGGAWAEPRARGLPCWDPVEDLYSRDECRKFRPATLDFYEELMLTSSFYIQRTS
mmetsp:Transcript_2686/g.4292  ORF Transcript_2686/g.4292 Transcript_2686/m.4292 type:complete len:559 (-) Transcript_2686:80-1756(-)